MPGTHHHPVTRFMSNVMPSTIGKASCWQWGGSGKGNGYGSFSLNGKTMPAHRAAYALFVGPVPSAMDVCHSCDNRACVNPDHLFLGTRADNMMDAAIKGRMVGRKGQRLTERQVQEIRRRVHAGERAASVSRSTGVGHTVISNIMKGKSHVRVGQ